MPDSSIDYQIQSRGGLAYVTVTVDNHKLFLVSEVFVESFVTRLQTYLNLALREVINPSEVFIIRRDEGHVPIVNQQVALGSLFIVNQSLDGHRLAFLNAAKNRCLGVVYGVQVPLLYLPHEDAYHLVLLHAPSGYVPTTKYRCFVEGQPFLTVLCITDHTCS